MAVKKMVILLPDSHSGSHTLYFNKGQKYVYSLYNHVFPEIRIKKKVSKLNSSYNLPKYQVLELTRQNRINERKERRIISTRIYAYKVRYYSQRTRRMKIPSTILIVSTSFDLNASQFLFVV